MSLLSSSIAVSRVWQLDVEISPIKLSYHGQSHYNSVRDRSLRYPLQPRR